MKPRTRPAPRRPADPAAANHAGEHRNVVVIFEMHQRVFRRLRPTLDSLIATHNLACHVRFDGDT